MSDHGEFGCQDFQHDPAAVRDIRLPGDWYHEHDDHTRGIAMAPMMPPELVGGILPEACGGHPCTLLFDKHFVEPDEELKDLLEPVRESGISMGSAGGIGVKQFGNDMSMQYGASEHPGHASFDRLGNMDPYEAHDLELRRMGELGRAEPPLWSKAPNILKTAVKFTEEHTPPEKPTSKHFRYEVTHVVVDSEQPHEIGNTLLDFFEGQVVASLTEVNHDKFAIKADVFVGSVMCTVKARVYKEKEDGRYAVEFQRRSGDGLAYSSTWKQAQCYLKSGVAKSPGKVDSDQPSAPKMDDIFPVPMEPMAPVEVDDQSLTPIHEMASFSEMPSLQAEAATALLGLAEGSNKQDFLLTEKMFKTIDMLVRSTAKEVEYAAAMLLGVLVAAMLRVFSPEKMEVFCSFVRLVLPGVLKKIVAEQTAELTQQKLLEVVYSVVNTSCRATVPDQTDRMEGEFVIDLTAQSIGPEGAAALAEALRANTSLQEALRQVLGADAEPCVQDPQQGCGQDVPLTAKEALVKALRQLQGAALVASK